MTLDELLASLHDAVASKLLERILSDDAKPADFAQAIKFLSDNGIDINSRKGDKVDILANSVLEELPFTDVNDAVQH